MGMRIHTGLGWGLDDVICEEYGKIQDPRINSQALDWDISEDHWYDYPKWFKEQVMSGEIDEMVKTFSGSRIQQSMFKFQVEDIKKGERKIDTSKNFTLPFWHDSEFGIPNVLVLHSIFKPEHQRRNDDIDYYFVHPDDQCEPYYRVLSDHYGIYPYIGKILKPGRTLPEGFLDSKEVYGSGLTLKDSLYQAHLEGKDPMELDPWVIRRYEGDTSFPQEFRDCFNNDFGLKVPFEILVLAKYLDIFTDFNTVYDLKPIVYRYWA